MSGLRLMLVALLVSSTALFATAAIAERSQTGARAEPASVREREGGESEGAHSEDARAERETLLGVDVESTPLVVLAVIAGLALALLVLAPAGRRGAVLLTIGAIAIAWAALDVREALHQSDESRTGIAILALAVALLHLAAAAVAVRVAALERTGGRSPGRPGTMPA